MGNENDKDMFLVLSHRLKTNTDLNNISLLIEIWIFLNDAARIQQSKI